MTRFISELAAGLEPYVPGEQPKDKKYVKLNTNENPYPPSKKVTDAISAEMKNLRLYPDPDATLLRDAAADYYNDVLRLSGKDALTRDNVFAGNGSDEVLAFIFPAFFKGKKIAFADITYSFYPVYAALFEVGFQTLPLKDDFSIDVSQYCNDLPDDVQAVILCNPNAPTGRALELSEIEEILKSNVNRLIVVDEAYVDFGARTAVGLVNRYENLLITQTLSKSRQLAGMRIGLAIGSKELIECVNRVKNSFNSYSADRLAIAAAAAAFEDREYFEETRGKITDTRQRVTLELEKIGFDVIPSAANFIFAEHKTVPAERIFKELRERGILVRYFPKPKIGNRLRISIGTDEDMDALLKALHEIFATGA